MPKTWADMSAEQRAELPIVPTKNDCTGRTFIVTGSNMNIGYHTVQHLVRLGAKRVIIAVRDLGKGKGAQAKIEAETGIADVLDVWEIDITSFDSIKRFAARATAELDRVDVLIENATICLDQWTFAEGYETSLAGNVIGTLLLAVLLLPKMKETARKSSGAKPHVVIVTTSLALDQDKAFERLAKTEGDIYKSLTEDRTWPLGMHVRYATSKLLLIFATRKLAALYPVEKTGVVINLVNPGLCNTGMARNESMSARLVTYFFNLLLGRTAEMGSRTELHAAVAGHDSHGKFLSGCEIKDSWLPDWFTDDVGQGFETKLWEQTRQRLENISPGCFAQASGV